MAGPTLPSTLATLRQGELFLFCWVSWEIDFFFPERDPPPPPSRDPSPVPVICTLNDSSKKQPALALGRRCKRSDGGIVAQQWREMDESWLPSALRVV